MKIFALKLVKEARDIVMEKPPALEQERADFLKLNGYHKNIYRALFFYHTSYNLKAKKYRCMCRVAKKFRIQMDNLWALWC